MLNTLMSLCKDRILNKKAPAGVELYDNRVVEISTTHKGFSIKIEKLLGHVKLTCTGHKGQYATRVMKTPQGYNGINSMYDCGVFHEHLDNMIVEVEDLVKVKPYK